MPEQRTAIDWIQQVMWGQGPYVGQFMGGLGMPAGQAAMGGLGLVGPGMLGGGGSPQGLASQLMMQAAMANVFSSPAMPFVGAGTANLTGRALMGLSAAGAFPNVQGGGGVMPGGFGIGAGAMPGMTSAMEGMTGPGPRDLSMMDVSRITASAGQGGFFGGVTDVRQARERMREMVRTVKEMSRELSMTIDEVSSGMNAMSAMGFRGRDAAAGALRQVMRTSAAGGFAPSETMAYQAQMGETLRGAAGIPLAMGSAAATNMLGFVGGAVRGGMVGGDTLQNAYGASGAQGAMMMSNRIQEIGLKMMDRAPVQFSMAAMMDPETGRVSQERMHKLLSGQLTPGDIQSMAGKYVGGLQGGMAQWQGQMPEMRGQFMAAGGDLAPLALAQMMMQQHGYGTDPNDPRSRAAFSAAMRNMGIRMNPMESRGMMELMGNLGNVSEANALTAARQQEQDQTNQRRLDQLAQRDPVYQLRRLTQDFSDKITRGVERYSTGAAQRLERLTDRAAGAGFDVVVSPELFSGREGARAFLGGAGVTAEDRQAGFFAESSRDERGRRELEEGRRATADIPSFMGRVRARVRLRGAERDVRASEAEGVFETRAFMGEDRGLYTLTPEKALERRGLPGTRSAEATAFRETEAARESFTRLWSAPSREWGGETWQRNALAREGETVADALTAFGQYGEAELMKRTRQLLERSSVGATDLSNRQVAAAALGFQKAGRALAGARGTTGAALGEMEYGYETGIGERYKTGGLAGLQRNVSKSARATFGDRYAREGETFAMQAPIAAQALLEALPGMGDMMKGVALQEYFKRGRIAVPEGISKDLLEAPVSSPEDLGLLIAGQGALVGARLAEDARRVGWLSDTQVTEYEKALGGGKLKGRALSFVTGMIGAGASMREGEGGAGYDQASRAMQDLLRTTDREYEQLRRAGAVKDPGEAGRLRGVFRRQRRRGVLDEADVTTAEFSAETGLESMKDIAKLVGRTAEELERMSPEMRSKRYEEYLANRAVQAGVGGAAKGGGMADEFKSALSDYAQGNALRVTWIGYRPGEAETVTPPEGT